MNNGYGSARTTREADFAAYDLLPSQMRDACKYAVAKWSCRHVSQRLDEWILGLGFSEPLACRSEIARMAETEPEDTYRTYGPTHPEADNHGRRLKPAKFATWGKRA